MTPRRALLGATAIMLVLVSACSSSSAPKATTTTTTTQPPKATETVLGFAPVVSMSARPCGSGALLGADDQCYVLGPVAVTLDGVASARAAQNNGAWSVHLTMTAAGIKSFNKVAAVCFRGASACPTKRLAVTFRGEVLSAPTIQAESYKRDQIQISGNFTEGEAKNIAGVVKSEKKNAG